jgi:homoserine O-acetyltransferase
VRRWFAACLLLGACAPPQQQAALGDFPLESGAILQDCRIGYRTFGRLDPDRGNAVLLVPWSMGTSGQLARKIGPGKLIDSDRYFVIAVDALANGVSSSPSNSTRQPGDAFPVFSMRDLVETQYALVRRALGLSHLRAVVGISLGGMQAFAWATAHPEFVDRVVAVAGTPRATPEEQQRWRAWMNDVQGTPWQRARRDLAGGAPLRALHDLDLDAHDYARQAQAIIGHDVTRPFGGHMQRAADAARGKLLVVVSAHDDVVDPAPARDFARLAQAPLVELDGACGHNAPSCQRATLAAAIARFIAR